MTTLAEKLAAAAKKKNTNVTDVKEPKKGRGRKKGTAVSKEKETKVKRKKAIGFNLNETSEEQINKSYEIISQKVERLGELVCTFMEGKRSLATDVRTVLQDLTKASKSMRSVILEAKNTMEPIYKD